MATAGFDLSLAGRTALVTGAGRGIGAGISRALAAAGAEVVLVARSLPQLECVAAEIAAKGGRARAIVADLGRAQDRVRLVAEAGPVDILVNNAAVKQRYVRSTHFPEDYWREVFEVGFWAPALLTRDLARGMGERGRGVVINVTSTAGSRANPYLGHYCASKAALEMVTRCTAIELGRFGVRVLGIAPGTIDTDHHALKDHPGMAAPVGRIGTPEDVGRLALFLASDAASFASGHVYTLDGATAAGDFSRIDPPYMAMVE